MISIYKITNTVNGKVYIGQTCKPVERRFRTHLRAVKDMVICRAVRRYGRENFTCITLATVSSSKLANVAEMKYVKLYRQRLGCHHVYNSTDGGGGVRGHHWKLSHVTKKRMSEAKTGVVFTKEHRKKLSEAASKRVMSVEQRQKISKSCKKVWTPKRRRWWANQRKGMRHSEATKRKMSKTHTGRFYAVGFNSFPPG